MLLSRYHFMLVTNLAGYSFSNVKPYGIKSDCSQPSIEQLLSQKDLQQGTTSGKQKKDWYDRKGKFAKIVMNSPNGIIP